MNKFLFLLMLSVTFLFASIDLNTFNTYSVRLTADEVKNNTSNARSIETKDEKRLK